MQSFGSEIGQVNRAVLNSHPAAPAEMAVKRANNYFDGIPVSKRQMLIFFTIVLAYFFEQMTNLNFAFVVPPLMKSWGLSKEQIAGIASLYFIGMTMGGLCGGIISDYLGRRKTFLGAILIFSTMSVINGFTDNLLIFTIARTLTGFGVFCMMTVSIAYISEMSPGESRGKWQNISAAAGFMAMPAIGLICREIIPTGPEAWRIIFFIGALGYLAFILGLKFLEESPRWLIMRGRRAEAEKVVEKVSGVAVDLSAAAANVPPKESARRQLFGMFGGQYRKRTAMLLACAISLAIPAFIITVWLPTVLNVKGFSLEDSLTIGLAYMCGGPAGLFLTSFVSDLGGRKIPFGVMALIVSALAVTLGVIGTMLYAAMLIAFLLNAIGTGAYFIRFSYAAEHYPTRMRNTAVGVINAVERLGVAGGQLLVPVVLAGYGFSGLFFSLAALYMISGLIVLIFGARTGGRSLEEIH